MFRDMSDEEFRRWLYENPKEVVPEAEIKIAVEDKIQLEENK